MAPHQNWRCAKISPRANFTLTKFPPLKLSLDESPPPPPPPPAVWQLSRSPQLLSHTASPPCLLPQTGVQDKSPEEVERFKACIKAKYDEEGSCYFSSARLWDDGVIDPRDTRKVLGLALAATQQTSIKPTRFGVFRM